MDMISRPDALIAASFASPSRNLFGQIGPRCLWCSGLGQVLNLVDGVHVRYASRCRCGGSGLDLDLIVRGQVSTLIDRIEEMERREKDLLNKQARFMRELNKLKHGGKMSRQFWMECISWATASGTAVAASTTETILFPNVTIPANYMQDGRSIRGTLWGGYGTTVTPTLIITIRWGGVAGTVIAKSATVTTTSGVGGGASMTALWKIEYIIQTRSNGSSATFMTNGQVTLHTSTAATAGTVTNYGLDIPLVSGSTGGTTPAVATVDATADTALSVTALWGTNNAANSIQGHQYNMESMN